MWRPEQHEACTGRAYFSAREEHPDVVRFRVFPTTLQAMVHRFETNLLAALTGFDTLANGWRHVMRHLFLL